MLRATSNYKNDNDNFSDFLDTFYIEDRDTFTTIHDIYSKFSIWWIEHYASSKILDIKMLKKALKVRYGRESTRSKEKGYCVLYTPEN